MAYIPAPPFASRPCLIGDFAFINLLGSPASVSDHGVSVHRPGRDTAVWFPGTFAKDFSLESHVDTFTPLHASQLFVLYRAAVGTAVGLSYRGIEWTDATHVCIIRDVALLEPNGIQELIYGIGGLCPPSRGFLRCRWDLSFVTKDS